MRFIFICHANGKPDSGACDELGQLQLYRLCEIFGTDNAYSGYCGNVVDSSVLSFLI